MKIRTRIFIYLLIIFSMIMSLWICHRYTLNSISRYQADEHSDHQQLLALYTIKISVQKYMKELGDDLFTNSNKIAGRRFALAMPLEKLRTATYKERWVLGNELSETEDNELDLINEIQATLIIMERDIALLQEHKNAGNIPEAKRLYAALSKKMFKAKFIELINKSLKEEESEVQKLHEEYTKLTDRADKINISIALLISLIILLASWYFIRDIVGSFTTLSNGAKRLVDGEYDTEITLDGDNEFSDMANTLNTLGETIRGKIEDQNLIGEEYKLAKEDADSSRQAMSEFLANMSHEVRTPLNGIIGLTDLLMKMDIKDEKQLQYISLVKDSGYRLFRIINDILDFSKIEAKRLDLESINFIFRETITSALAPLEVQALEKGLAFSCTFAEDIPESMIGDPVRLTQILINLVNNAIKFTDSGQIGINIDQATRLGSSLVLHFEVYDTGIGVPLEVRNKIFRPFTQAESSIARNFGGSGLGLAISSELALLMGGKLWIESGALPARRREDTSKRKHPGSSFHFTVHLEALPEKITTPKKKSDTSVIKASLPDTLHILLVDDEPINRMLVFDILTAVGWQVHEGENGKQALKMMEESDFDIVLMDIEMPGLDGLEVTRRYRTKEAGTGKHLPIIAMTAHATEGFEEKCLAADMDGYIAKPFENDELIEIIARNIPNIHTNKL